LISDVPSSISSTAKGIPSTLILGAKAVSSILRTAMLAAAMAAAEYQWHNKATLAPYQRHQIK
jgi:hypothetical protein